MFTNAKRHCDDVNIPVSDCVIDHLQELLAYHRCHYVGVRISHTCVMAS